MSIKVMTLVWSKSRNKRTALLLLLAIADHAHDDGTGAYPGIELLARKTRQTDRNVQLLLKTLEDSRELKILEGQGPHGCNKYEINLKLLNSYPEWERAEETDDSETDKAVERGENFSPPKTFHPENLRDENAENFTGGVKNSANDVLENDKNKLENAHHAHEISPEPLNRQKATVIEPSAVDFEKTKTDVRDTIKSLFTLQGETDWTIIDVLCKTITREILMITAYQMQAIGSRVFSVQEFSGMAQFNAARAAHLQNVAAKMRSP